jgi:hypothetical protein
MAARQIFLSINDPSVCRARPRGIEGLPGRRM